MELVVLTNTFPYGKGEEFIENEYCFWESNFSHVTIMPIASNLSDIKRETGGKIQIFRLDFNCGILKKIKTALPEFFSAAAIRDLLRGIRMSGRPLTVCRSLMAFLAQKKMVSEKLLEYINANVHDDFVLYSYWMHIGASAIADFDKDARYGVGKKHRLCAKVCRCHGYDIYEESNELNWLPMRQQILQGMDCVYPIAVNGKNYLQKRYPAWTNKCVVSHLGTINHSERMRQEKNGGTFHIVSCSNVIQIKRVDRIFRALRMIDACPLLWTHFGDGDEMDTLKTLINKENKGDLEIRLKGHYSNKDILHFYETENCHLFINVSSSEGLPVSIMEACSYGIPVIATDVGGSREIVKTGYNGILLDADFEIADLADVIKAFIDMDSQKYRRYSANSRKMWEECFKAEDNYSKFIRSIKQDARNCL